MRIRIVQNPPIASVDGIRLDCFHMGREYEVGNSLAALFLAEGWAEPVPLDAPAPILPFSDNDPFDHRLLYPTSRSPEQPKNLFKVQTPPSVDPDLADDVQRWRRPRRR